MRSSKNLAPTYEKLADSYQHLKNKVVIAKVDGDAQRELAQRFDVTGICYTLSHFTDIQHFPHLRHFTLRVSD